MKYLSRFTSITSIFTMMVIALCSPVTIAADALKITVYGASGMIGSGITNEALNRGHHVTGITRNPSNIKIQHENLSTAKGDVTVPESVTEQIAGQDVVITAVRGNNSPDGNPDPKQSVEYRAAQALMTAVRSLGNNAPRLVFVGGASTLESEPGISVIDNMIKENKLPPGSIGAMFVAHELLLEELRETSDIKWTVLTPSGSIRPGERTGKFQLGTNTSVKDAEGNSSISVEDYSIALVDELENPKNIGKRFTVGY